MTGHGSDEPQQPSTVRERLKDLAKAPLVQRERACDDLARRALAQGEAVEVELTWRDFADSTPAALFAERYWRRRLAQQPTLREACACGRWIAAQRLPRPDGERLVEQWLVRAGQQHSAAPPTAAEVDAVVVDAVTAREPWPWEALYAVVLYHAGQLWQQAAVGELAPWLTDSALAMAVPTVHHRPVVQALLAWEAFHDPEARAQAHLRWGRAWDMAMRHDGLVAEILLSALTTPYHYRGAAGEKPPRGELLSAHDRLAAFAATALKAHPDAPVLRYYQARGLREIGRPREAAAALRAALRALPTHAGADWWRQRCRAELKHLPWQVRIRGTDARAVRGRFPPGKLRP
jgi:hypothetical protein